MKVTPPGPVQVWRRRICGATSDAGTVFPSALIGEDGSTVTFRAIVRLDSGIEVEYYRNGGIHDPPA